VASVWFNRVVVVVVIVSHAGKRDGKVRKGKLGEFFYSLVFCCLQGWIISPLLSALRLLESLEQV